MTLFDYPAGKCPPVLGHGDVVRQGEVFALADRPTWPLVLRWHDAATGRYHASNLVDGGVETALLRWPGGGDVPAGRRELQRVGRWCFMTLDMAAEHRWLRDHRAALSPAQAARLNDFDAMAYLDARADGPDSLRDLTEGAFHRPPDVIWRLRCEAFCEDTARPDEVHAELRRFLQRGCTVHKDVVDGIIRTLERCPGTSGSIMGSRRCFYNLEQFFSYLGRDLEVAVRERDALRKRVADMEREVANLRDRAARDEGRWWAAVVRAAREHYMARHYP